MKDLNLIISEIRPILEIIYFLSGVAVAIAALIALKQISILKRTLTIQSKRDALKITSEQCSNYYDKIIPLQDHLDEDIKKNNVKFFDGWQITVENGSISVVRKDKPDMTGFDKIEEYHVLNKMESFSNYFVSGVADESVAYTTLGVTFINSTKKLMPMIAHCNQSGYYKNITKLFILWETRREKEKLLIEKRELDEKIQNTKSYTFTPIGTEIT